MDLLDQNAKLCPCIKQERLVLKQDECSILEELQSERVRGGLALTCLDSPPTDRPLIKEGEEKEHKQAAESLPSRLPLI